MDQGKSKVLRVWLWTVSGVYCSLQIIWDDLDDLLEVGVIDNLPSFIRGLIFNLQNGLCSVGQKIKASISHANSCIVLFFCFYPLQQVQHGIMYLSWLLLKSGTFSNSVPLSHSTEEVIHY